MIAKSRLGFLTLALGLIVCGRIGHSQDLQSHPTSRKPTSITGCMTTACHGSNSASDAPLWQRSGKIWFDLDPHARAYTSLLSDESRQIVERLTNESVSVASRRYRDILEEKCVSCHASENAPVSQRLLGADCQVCHGAAEAWGDEHYSKEWKSLGNQRFDPKGKWNVESFASRASVCASCHVGELNRTGRDRQVDHRLMAAGHPPMHFDFELFSLRYPKHWDSTKDPVERQGESSFRRWRIGKLESTISRLKLLSERAHRAEQKRQAGSLQDWPELTEYSCFRCHHPLQQPSWRQVRGADSSMQWDPWCTALLELAVSEESSSQVLKLASELKSTMESSTQLSSPFAPSSVSQKVAPLLQLLENERSQIAADVPWSETRYRATLSGILKREDMFAEWESAAQWSIVCRSIAAPLKLDLPKLSENVSLDPYFGNARIWTNRIAPSAHSAQRFRPETLIEFKGSLMRLLDSKP
ncbi:MAG: multiheme c-type cytochrome [Pirellula sp.]